MTKYSIIPLTAMPEIRIRNSTQYFVPELVEAVDKVWSEAYVSNQELHDGRIFSVESASVDVIIGSWLPYRFFYACSRDEMVAAKLFVCPLAITGICVTIDGEILLGRRSAFSTQYPGAWDILPAGSVDLSTENHTTPDVKTQLMAELAEEVGDVEVQSVDLKYIARHPDYGPVDIVYLIKLAAKRKDVVPALSSEHSQIAYFKIGEGLPDNITKPAALLLEKFIKDKGYL